jgi:hypothetical protein
VNFSRLLSGTYFRYSLLVTPSYLNPFHLLRLHLGCRSKEGSRRRVSSLNSVRDI